MSDQLEISVFTPKKIQNANVKEQVDSLGLELFNLLQTFNHIRSEIDTESSSKPHVLWQLIKQSISVLSTEDPSKIHYEIVRTLLKKYDENLLNNHSVLDMFARELCTNFKTLNAKLIIPKAFKETLDSFKSEADKAIEKEGLQKELSLDVLELPQNIDELESLFEKNGKFIWDNAFINLLEGMGSEGRDASKELKKTLSSSNINMSKEYWFNMSSHDSHLFLSQSSMMLAHTIYIEKIKRLAGLAENSIAALTTPVQKNLAEMLSPYNAVEREGEKQINIVRKEQLIGSISIPAISPKMVNSVFKGAAKLNTVTGHRIIRHFPQEAFNLMVSGEPDYRVIKYERGATEIAERLGLHGNQHVSNIKEIVHAMAYFQFSQESFSGNLIQLSKHKSSITHRKEVYIITVGSPLLPYRTFEDGGLLIPLLSDPPLVNPTQSYASQYLLQMETMSEFSKQSIYLAKHGFIEITENMWGILALSCDINKGLLKKVHDRWMQDGTDAPKFLEQIDNNYYALGKEHERALLFLKEQGKIRERNSKGGKVSAQRKALIKQIKP